MTQYSTGPRTRKDRYAFVKDMHLIKDMHLYHLQENIKKQLLDTGLDAVKTASKKVVHQPSKFQ